jgi:hypothetical protein
MPRNSVHLASSFSTTQCTRIHTYIVTHIFHPILPHAYFLPSNHSSPPPRTSKTTSSLQPDRGMSTTTRVSDLRPESSISQKEKNFEYNWIQQERYTYANHHQNATIIPPTPLNSSHYNFTPLAFLPQSLSKNPSSSANHLCIGISSLFLLLCLCLGPWR